MKEYSNNISLDGIWDFTVDSLAIYDIKNINKEASWREAQVPLSWQAQFADLRDYSGVAWYRKQIELTIPDPGQICFLRFGYGVSAFRSHYRHRW